MRDQWSTEKFHLSYKEGFLITNQYLDNHAAMVGHFSRCKCHHLNVISPYAKASCGPSKYLGVMKGVSWRKPMPEMRDSAQAE